MELTQEVLKIAERYKTPFLLVNPSIISKNIKRIKQSIPVCPLRQSGAAGRKDIEVYYAIKANSNSKVLEFISNQDVGFEISSIGELEYLLRIGVSPSRIISSNPIKETGFIKRLSELGADFFVYDSQEEANKIALLAPKSKVCLRLAVENTGSQWPLARKFGVELEEAFNLLSYAKGLDLIPYGLMFHVGSQCLNKDTWLNALNRCKEVWNQATNVGMKLKILNLGGGLPIKHMKRIPDIESIGKSISLGLRNFSASENGSRELARCDGSPSRLLIEPGRAIIGDAAIMVTSVIGKAKRRGENWLYLDVGVFTGLMETIEGFDYELVSPKSGTRKNFIVAGPTCDSVDKMFENKLLPDLGIGDKVYILNAGAYTLSYASHFNGFNPPEVYLTTDPVPPRSDGIPGGRIQI